MILFLKNLSTLSYFAENESRFEMSVASMDQKPFLCNLCYEAFTSLDTLNEHKHNKHPLRTDNDFLVCCHCKSVFTVEEELNEHLQVHNCKKLDPETRVGTHMFQKIADTDQKLYVCNVWCSIH